MSHFGGRPTAEVRCAICTTTGAIWEVWKVNLCPRCHAEWLADERFSVGAINDALQQSSAIDAWSIEAGAMYAAEAEKRTRAWVGEQRTKARAA